MIGGGDAFLVSTVASSYDTNIVLFLNSQRAEAEKNKAKSLFDDTQTIEDVMSGLRVDPRYPDITFVTPSSWIFHAVEFSAYSKLAVICTTTMRVFSSSFVKELVLLYVRCIYLSPCFQEDRELAILISKLDVSFMQAASYADHQYHINGYTNDLSHLDDSRCISFFDHFWESYFKSITFRSLICENVESACPLRTHQGGFYLNAALLEKNSSQLVKAIKNHVWRQEYFRFSTLLSAPLVVGHEISAYHRLAEFVSQEIKTAEECRTRLLVASNANTYRLPFLTTKEYAKNVLQNLMAKRTIPASSEQPPSEKELSGKVPPKENPGEPAADSDSDEPLGENKGKHKKIQKTPPEGAKEPIAQKMADDSASSCLVM